MKAIIMAGGLGSRLRPLTCNRPKPLAPLCGRPVIEYILDLLMQHGCNSAALTLMYQGEKIQQHLGQNNYKGIALSYAYEQSPLGTAGSVKNAINASNFDEDLFVIISADAMCDFDLKAAIEFHKAQHADATILAKRVDDPREYGLVNLSDKGLVTGFVEKPSYASCTTDLANTGVYILSRSVLDLIPEHKQSDFAQDIFPAMLEKGMRLCGYEEQGYWCDIGDFSSYIRCQRDMLAGRVKCDIVGHRSLEGIIMREPISTADIHISAPAYIGSGVKIGRNAVIEAGSVIDDNVTIGENSKIHASVLLDGAYISSGVRCNEAIICQSAKLGHGSAVYEGAVVGENAIVGENAVVESGVKLWQGRHLEAGSTASYDIKYGYGRNLCCDEDGICGETNTVITPQIAAKLGGAATAVSPNDVVAIASTCGGAGHALRMAFIAGVMAAGGIAWDFGECSPTEFNFAMRKSLAPIGALIETGITCVVHLFDQGGLPLTRTQERKLERGLNKGEYPKASWNGFGKMLDMGGMRAMYTMELENIVSQPLNGIKAYAKSPHPSAASMLTPILNRINDMDGEDVIFSLTSNGKKASALTEQTGLVPHEKLIMLACESYFAQGKAVALPFDFPAAVDVLAQRYGAQVQRYYSCTCDKTDEQARSIARDCAFYRDGLILSLEVLSHLSREGLTLYEAIDRLPRFSRSSRLVALSSNLQSALKRIGAQGKPSNDGILIEEERGRVLLHPTKAGNALLVYAESVSAEHAAELCDDFEQRFRELSLDS